VTENNSETHEAFEVPSDMKVYYLRQLKRGPIWTAEETPEVERLQAAHLAYGRSLHEAQALSDADPAVQAGRLISEIHPWMVHKGILPE
jgi:hypothetical protein